MRSVQLKRWTRDEYDRLVAAGVLSPEDRVELVDGEIIEMAPQNPAHATGVHVSTETLRRVFQHGYTVRSQFPLGTGPRSEPEPDVAVVRGHWRDFTQTHPTAAVLVVEISDSSLSFDRGRKAPDYASGGIPEYWIVNLIDRVLEVYRDPRPDLGYATRLVFGEDATIAPLAAPSSSIAVRDLLP